MKNNELGWWWVQSVLLVLANAVSGQTLARPQLDVQPTAAQQLRFQWTSSATNFVLESSDALGINAQWQSVGPGTALSSNQFTVTLPVAVQTRFFRLNAIAPPTPATVFETSPSRGESGVAVMRPTVVRFTAPLAQNSAVTEQNFSTSFGGRQLLTRVELSADRKTATLFYLENMPAGTRVNVVFDGTGLLDETGQAVDADGDGVPGGILSFSFDTANNSSLPTTAVSGHVYAAEAVPDLAHPGSLTNLPLNEVTITVDGAEETLRTTTDQNGFFLLQPAPAGRFFVHVDGRTAQGSQWPQGTYYPFVGKAWETVPGRTNNLANGTGDIFLPLIPADALQPVSAVSDTTIHFPPSVIAANPAFADVSITVPANDLFSDSGVRGGRVGIAPVPPDRLPEPLPAGLSFPLVITIQTDGPLNFDRPVPIRFPNLPDPKTGVKLAAGEKMALWSFNHRTGRWEIQGPATVTSDGNFVVSDPGFGVRQPGWNWVAPGNSGCGPNCPSCNPRCAPPPDPNCSQILDPTCDDRRPCKTKLTLMVNSISDMFQDLLLSAVTLGADTAITCPFGATVNSLRAGRDCTVDPTGCGGTVKDNAIGAGVGCIPEIGSILSLGWDGKGVIDNVFNYIDCRNNQVPQALVISPHGGGSHGGATPADTEPPELQEVVAELNDQLRFSSALSNGVAALFGSQVWANASAAGDVSNYQRFFSSLAVALDNTGPGGSSIIASERAALLALPLPGGVSVQDAGALLDRFALFGTGGFQSGTPAGDAFVAAANQFLTVAQELAAKGWQTPYDGLFNALAKLSYLREPQVGSDLFPASPHFYLLLDLQTGFVQRGRLDSQGQFPPLILSQNSFYMVAYLDPQTLRIGTAMFRSALSGQTTRIPAASLLDPSGVDTDGDGLTDFAEEILGTNPALADSDGDGIPDGQEVLQGSNPLDGQITTVGAVASVSSAGQAVDVCAVNDTAFVANADAAVAIFNVANPAALVLLAEAGPLDPALAVFSANGLLSVANGSKGVSLFDVSQPAQPKFLWQQSLGSSAVAITRMNGVTFAGTAAGDVVALDDNGIILSQVRPGGAIQDLTAGQGVVYALEVGKLHTLLFSNQVMTLVSTVLSPGNIGGGTQTRLRLFAAGTRLLSTHSEGFNVFDLTNPLAPTNGLSFIQQTLAWRHVILDDAGLALAANLSFPGDETFLDLSLYKVGTTVSNSTFITSLPTPGAAYALCTYKGYALVADGAAGLTVIKYRSNDASSQAPTLTLMGTFQPGLTQQEGGVFFRLNANTLDQAGVRNVEFYLDGSITENDGNFPFESYLRAPDNSPTKTNFTVQARAFDTHGLFTWSPLLNVELLPNTTTPLLSGASPTNGSLVASGSLSNVVLAFSKSMNPATLTPGSLQLQINGHPLAAQLAYSPLNRSLTIALAAPIDAGVAGGPVKLLVAPGITDLSGNSLATNTVYGFSITRHLQNLGLGTNIDWGAALNWSGGALPGPTDTVELRSPDTNVARNISTTAPRSVFSLTAFDGVTLSGAGLQTSADAIFYGPLNIVGQAGITAGGTISTYGPVDFLGSGNASFTGQWDNFGQAVMDKLNSTGLNLNGPSSVFHNLSAATFELREGHLADIQGQGSVFDNAGQVLKTTTNQFQIVGPSFRNTGLVDVREGTLLLSGPAENLGIYRVAAGATLTLAGGGFLNSQHHLWPASLLEGAGNVSFGSSQSSGTYQALVDGDIDMTGPIDFSGSTVVNGHLLHSGPITVNNSSSVTFNGLAVQFDNPVTVNSRTLLINVPTPVILPALQAASGVFVGGSSTISVTGQTRFLAGVSGLGANIQGTGRFIIAGPLESHGLLTVATVPLGGASQVLELAVSTQWPTNSSIRLINALLRNMTNAVYEFAGGGDVSGLAFENYGTVLKNSPETNVIDIGTIFGGMTNRGSLLVQAGRLNMNALTQLAGQTVISGGTLAGTFASGVYLMIVGGEFEVSGGQLVNNDITVSGGRMRLVNATLNFSGSPGQASSQFNIIGGVFAGTGTLNGLDTLLNGGEVSPGDGTPGILTLTYGEYTQTSPGKLTIFVGGPQPGVSYGQLQTVMANLDGTLEIDLVNGFVPNLGDEFKIVTTQNKLPNGQFATITGSVINASEKFQVVYDTTGVTLRVVPGP